ncbi:MAG: hypothetical protein KGL15_11695 [Acidobacteriota bacterium]|nr:hypothetical protein [Acidobacteriota bacterium]
MSQAENPERLRPDHEVTLEDVHALMGASTPHFAMQLRVRVRALIKGLPAEHPARIAGEREIARLNEIAYDGEVRGQAPEEGLPPLASLNARDITVFAPDTGH